MFLFIIRYVSESRSNNRMRHITGNSLSNQTKLYKAVIREFDARSDNRENIESFLQGCFKIVLSS